ncbi:dipeptidase [Parapedomonas caeni]
MVWFRRGLIALGALALIGVIGLVSVGPGWVDARMNPVLDHPLPALRPDSATLHKQLVIVDLHADPLLWRRDLVIGHDHGHIDLARLERGNIALQVFSSVTKTPRNQNYENNGGDTDNITPLVMAQLQPVRTWHSLLQRSLYHAEKLDRFAARSQGRLRVIRTRADLAALLADRAAGRAVTGGLLSVEGLQNLEGRLDNLDRLDQAGFRMLGLAHFFDNEVAGSVHGIAKHGLTPFGRQVVAEMERRRLVIDIAHASHAAIAEVLAMATRPVVYSHGGVKGTCDNNRNLTDAEIDGVAATGGLIAIGFWDTAVCDATPAGIARAILYVRDRVGIDHVALGSDWDGAVAAPFDAAHLAALTQALLDAGLSEADLGKVMGGNAVKLFAESLPDA